MPFAIPLVFLIPVLHRLSLMEASGETVPCILWIICLGLTALCLILVALSCGRLLDRMLDWILD